MEDKHILAGVIIVCMSCIQIIAFVTGHNGAILGFTSLIIGGIAGSVFGFTVGLKKK